MVEMTGSTVGRTHSFPGGKKTSKRSFNDENLKEKRAESDLDEQNEARRKIDEAQPKLNEDLGARMQINENNCKSAQATFEAGQSKVITAAERAVTAAEATLTEATAKVQAATLRVNAMLGNAGHWLAVSNGATSAVKTVGMGLLTFMGVGIAGAAYKWLKTALEIAHLVELGGHAVHGVETVVAGWNHFKPITTDMSVGELTRYRDNLLGLPAGGAEGTALRTSTPRGANQVRDDFNDAITAKEAEGKAEQDLRDKEEELENERYRLQRSSCGVSVLAP